MHAALAIERASCQSTYPVSIGKRILSREPLLALLEGKKGVILSDETVARLYGNQLRELLASPLLTVPSGESFKTREVKLRLEDEMFELGLGRDTVLFALGGGVICDLSGFLAATYCRGIDLVSIPTSLLAMVDACIGGKNGVNTSYGKNLIGTIHDPKAVFIDMEFLTSLPEEELRNGMVETIKHGLIGDRSYFQVIERSLEELLKQPQEAASLVLTSCQIKGALVFGDEREGGKRRLLNYGHTVGHALEALSNYSLSHGRAVALGIKVESFLSHELAGLSQRSLKRINALFDRCYPDLALPPNLEPRELLEAMKRDKKALEGKPRFVLLEEIGEPASYGGAFCTAVPEGLIEKAFESYFGRGF